MSFATNFCSVIYTTSRLQLHQAATHPSVEQSVLRRLSRTAYLTMLDLLAQLPLLAQLTHSASTFSLTMRTHATDYAKIMILTWASYVPSATLPCCRRRCLAQGLLCFLAHVFDDSPCLDVSQVQHTREPMSHIIQLLLVTRTCSSTLMLACLPIQRSDQH